MNLCTKIIWSQLLVIICATVLLSSHFVWAQEDTSARESTPAPADSTATTTAKKPWYTSDFISGDIKAGDFVIGPGKIELTIKPGESVIKMISVTNRIADNKTFELMVEDMSGSADPSQAVVLLGDQNGPYSLRDYFSFPDKNFTLALGERAQIPVTITIPPNAEPGGYYGAVLVTTIQSSVAEGSNVNTPVIARIGTLFFITVPGKFEKSGLMTDFSTVSNKFLFTKGPINLGILFENTGSIHLAPYGEVKVSNLFGEEVGFVEIEPWFVLPKSQRLRELSWDRELLLGRYTITANINRGYDDVIDTKVIHVWVLPWQFMLGVFASIFILFMFVRFVTSRFEFKRKTSK